MAAHVVIDGSNIATEGRARPSLRQLKDAVAALSEEQPNASMIIVADATFGHRIETSEVAEFDRMVETGQIVTPPAGAIGRGDAFVLTIANKAKAVVLSNDSFQEFHGTYPWLFDEGRLIGGKPVPHVGWVFVLRSPVRGPLSRRSQRDAKKPEKKPTTTSRTSKAASEPLPAPKTPPPTKKPAKAALAAAPASEAPRPKQMPINALAAFLEFVASNPIGAVVEGEVENFSSHGVYVTIGPVRGYAPLRNLGMPAPRSAREVVSVGDKHSFVVVGFNPERRGIDVAFPAFVPAGIKVLEPGATRKGRRTRATKQAAAPPLPLTEEPKPAKPARATKAAKVEPAPAKARTRATKKQVTPLPAPAPSSAVAPAKRTRKKAAAAAGGGAGGAVA
ncbi:MAG: S1 RNA-binding domain-containing protein [Acidimicrobiales bacterium]